jgi:hypothetical protein
MLPFTHEQFIFVFTVYNGAIWPLQPIVHGVGFAMLALLLGRARWRGTANAVVLASMWIWTGLVYQIGFFSRINPAAFAFGALFVLEGALLLDAALRGTLACGAARGLRRALGWAFVVYSLLLYPLLGMGSGAHPFELPAFGLTPCPVTLTTFGMLLLATPATPRRLFAIPIAWALVGGSAAWLLGMSQDWPLLLVPVAALAVVIDERRRSRALPAAASAPARSA